MSLKKNFLSFLPGAQTINGITITFFEPILNPLSYFNYNLDSVNDYYLYLLILRLLEILVIFVHIKSFQIKITIYEFFILIFLYVIYLGNFSGFDHHSHINFPILIFCLFHALSLRVKNNYLFFLILFIGNAWAYALNPIYFIITCFGPLLFYYSFFVYEKKYRKIFLIFLANIIFTISFIFIAIGTARFSLGDMFPGSDAHYNFTIFKSKTFLFTSLIFFIYSIKNFYENKNNKYSILFLIIFILTLIFGIIYKRDPESWKLPPPEYLDYSIQFIYIAIVFMVLNNSKKNIIYLLLFALLFLPFGYRVYDFGKNFIITKDYKEIIAYQNSNNTIEKKYFWDDINNFEFKNDLEFKRVLLDLPNLDPKLFESTWEKEIKTDGKNRFLYEILKFSYNKFYQGPLSWQTFWNNNITINEGHSQYLDVSSVLANLENFKIQKVLNKKYKTEDKIYFSGGKILIRQTIPKISINSDLINLYLIDFILSDRKLLNYKLFKKYEYEEFDLYIYELNNLKNKNIKKL